jgi:hypothetical protein
VVSDYKWFASNNKKNITTQECVTHFKNWLEKDKGDSINTCRTKLAHVKKYLNIAYEKNVNVNFFRGKKKPVNPHDCYKEADIMQLIEYLRGYSDSR